MSSPPLKTIINKQLGSEIPDESIFQMVKKRLVCKWLKFWIASEIWKPDHLKSGEMAAILLKTIWNPDNNIKILKGSIFKLLGL